MKIQEFLESLIVCLNKSLSFFNNKIIYHPQTFDSNLEIKTQEGMRVSLLEFLEKLTNVQSEVHDLKIMFESDLHRYLVKKGHKVNQHNKSIKLEVPTSEENLTVKILVYPHKVQVDIGCSFEPFTCDANGVLRLTSLLNRISQVLTKSSAYKAMIPDIAEWIVTHRHYGKDGNLEYSGETFHIAYQDMVGEFTRVYTKLMPDGRVILREEKIETMKNTIGQEIQNMENESSKLPEKGRTLAVLAERQDNPKHNSKFNGMVLYRFLKTICRTITNR